ncbi:MAG: dynamin family protein [Betaproteobacteria bacterium]|nr:dynamin family protein [Betaproteobacteria bacterium]
MSRANFLTERLADLQSWRFGLLAQINRIRGILAAHEFLLPNTAAAFDDATRMVENQRITIAFVAEVARGKSELINALFFANLGRRLLPSGPGRGTRCVTEVRFDRAVRTSIRLLPVETRESPLTIEQLMADDDQWRWIHFDADAPDSVARALAALSETKRISMSDAVSWGLHTSGVLREGGGEGVAQAEASAVSLVDVPRWRYAIINIPHPMLDAGLVVVDTPGLTAFTSEPELSRRRVPSADAVLLILDATNGAGKGDLTLWKDFLGGAPVFRQRVKVESDQTRLVVLNKIDEIPLEVPADSPEAPRQQLKEIDQRVRQTAELLRLDPIRVVAVSARLGLAGKLENNNDKAMRSRLYQLERTLAANLPAHRQEMLAASTMSSLSSALESAQAELDNDRYETLEGLRALTQLMAKNEKLGGSLSAQANARQDRLDGALRELKSVRNVHVKLGTELGMAADVATAKRDTARARAAIVAGAAQGTVQDTLAQYLGLIRERLDAVEAKIEEVRSLHQGIGERLTRDFGIKVPDVHPFATQRFYTELEKVREQAQAEFARAGNLLVRRGTTLGEQFDQVIGARCVHMFEIASREATAWMRGLYAALEKPLEKFRDETLERVASVEKLKGAEIDLAEKVASLQARLDAIKKKHSALEEARESLARFSGEREDLDAA